MKKSAFSRRKFLSGMGLAAGAAAVAPSIKGLQLSTKHTGDLLDAWKKPQNALAHTLHPVRIVFRPTGSNLLPLSRRPL